MKTEDLQVILTLLWLALTVSGTWIGYLLRHSLADLALVAFFIVLWSILSVAMGATIHGIANRK